MPYKIRPVGGGKVRVSTPSRVTAKATTPAKAKAQIRAIEMNKHRKGK